MLSRDDIIKLAREAGWRVRCLDGEDEVMDGDDWHIQTDLVERFAALVAAAENEACAKLCDWLNGEPRLTPAGCAAAIRARRPSTISPATLIDPRGSLGEPIV
jgi:hypothetical protein